LGYGQKIWNKSNDDTIIELKKQLDELELLDLESELEQHIALDEFNKTTNELKELVKAEAGIEAIIQRENRNLKKSESDLDAAKNHQCYACGQALHDVSNKTIISAKTKDVAEANELIDENQSILSEINLAISEIELPKQIPVTKYMTAQEAYEQQSQLSTLKSKIETAIKADDPYTDQINTLKNDGVQAIEWDIMNNLHNLQEHQDFLYKLLTNKDSFIRKRIIKQNLQYLNLRLNYYLSKLGLPHEVIFQSDLNVEITELGRELDFDNLSRGERNRLILGLSWAFRDVHESTNIPIDFMAIDELFDSGMDSNGVEAALAVLKKMCRDRSKNIFLISHREELVGRVGNTLEVLKENGFTSFEFIDSSIID